MARTVPISVVETPEFLSATRKRMSDEERALLVDYLAYNPTAGDLIPGTGGVWNVWPARFARVFCVMCRSVRVNVSGLGACSLPRWRAARSGSHKLFGITFAIPHGGIPERRLTVRPSRSDHPQTTKIGPCAPSGARAERSQSRRRHHLGVEYRARPRHCPGNARALAGQCHHRNVPVHPRGQATQPMAERRRAGKQARQGGACATDQQLAQIFAVRVGARRRPECGRDRARSPRGGLRVCAGAGGRDRDCDRR